MATDANQDQAVVNNEPNEKVTFDERQQKKVDELIKDAQGRAGKEIRQELTKSQERLTALEKELQEAREAQASASTRKEKSDAQDDVDDIKAQLNEAKRVLKAAIEEAESFKQKLAEKDKVIAAKDEENMSFRKRTMLHGAAERVGFVDVQDVISLTSDAVVWSEERSRFVVIDPETKAERRNASFDLMTVEEFYNEYASKKPHLVKTDMRGGAGSSEGSKNLSLDRKIPLDKLFGKNAIPKLANDMAINQPAEYRANKQRAREAGLI